MSRNGFGVWEVTLPAKNGSPAIPHNSYIKVYYAYDAVLLLQITHD